MKLLISQWYCGHDDSIINIPKDIDYKVICTKCEDIICQFIDELISFPDRYILQTFIQLNVYIICKAVNSKFLEFLIIIPGNNNSLHCIIYRYVWEEKKKNRYIYI